MHHCYTDTNVPYIRAILFFTFHSVTTPLPLSKRRPTGHIRYTKLHIRHLVLPILTAAPPPSSYITSWVGTPAAIFFYYLSLRRHRAILLFQPRHGFLRHSLLAILLPPRHLVFHFPTTSGLPQALPLSHLATSAPSCFSLSNPVRSSSGTPTFEVHEQVVPST
jgi:hypothetical protein